MSTQTGNNVVTRKYTFPLPSGTASISLPFPMTTEDHVMLMRTLEIFKTGMVRPAKKEKP